MDVATVTTIISTVGFPITMCMVLLWYVKELTQTHKKESEEFTKALNTNTLVLEKLCNTLGVERGEE